MMQDRTGQEVASKRRNWILAIVLIGLPVLFCGTCLIGEIYWFFSNPEYSINPVTDQDFNTNDERIEYLNQYLPITLPNDSTIVSMHHEGFQGFSLRVEVQVPINEIDALIQTLPPLDEIEPDQFKGNVGPDLLEIEIDRETGTLHIEFFTI